MDWKMSIYPAQLVKSLNTKGKRLSRRARCFRRIYHNLKVNTISPQKSFLINLKKVNWEIKRITLSGQPFFRCIKERWSGLKFSEDNLIDYPFVSGRMYPHFNNIAYNRAFS